MLLRISCRLLMVGFKNLYMTFFVRVIKFFSFYLLNLFVSGVKSVEVDLSNQVVRILGSTPAKTMTEALEQTGRKARLIGQGVPEG